MSVLLSQIYSATLMNNGLSEGLLGFLWLPFYPEASQAVASFSEGQEGVMSLSVCRSLGLYTVVLHYINDKI